MCASDFEIDAMTTGSHAIEERSGAMDHQLTHNASESVLRYRLSDLDDADFDPYGCPNLNHLRNSR